MSKKKYIPPTIEELKIDRDIILMFDSHPNSGDESDWDDADWHPGSSDGSNASGTQETNASLGRTRIFDNDGIAGSSVFGN